MGVKNIIGELTINSKKVVTEESLAGLATETHVNTEIQKEHNRAASAESNLQTQINTIMNNPDTEGIINSINEFTEYIEEDGALAEGFRNDINDLQKRTIVDVISLPTSNINDKATYRLLSGIFMRGGLMRNDYNCYIVEWDSPSGNGDPVIRYVDGEMVVSGYYNNKNNTVYGYVDSVTKTAITEKIDQMVADGSLNSIVAAGLKLAVSTMSTGWKTMDEIFSNAVVSQLASWGGIITSLEQATNEDAAYVLLYDEFYSYKHNTWIGVDLHIGMSGDGPGAEKFNDINNIASGARSHAEGNETSAIGGNSHVEGYATVAEGNASHAEGAGSKTYALAAHAEGRDSYANSEASHAEGEFTSATGVGSHTEGYKTRTNGKGAHHEGIRLDGSETVTKNNIEYIYGANTDAAHAEGINTVAGGALEHKAAHAEGADTIAAGWSAHAEGLGSYAVGSAAHAEGRGTSANGEGSHAEGRDTVAQGTGAHVEGVRLAQYEPAKRDGKEYNFGAFAQGAHAEGLNTGAHGEASHTEGSDTIVTARSGHAEGLATYVTGEGAHAEGRNTWATANYAHSEGYATKAQGAQSHAAGSETIAKGASSYAGGTTGSTAHLTGSFVHGKGVKDDRWYQAVFGLYNKHETTTNDNGEVVPVETSDYLVVGCGGADNERDNCFTAGKSSTDGKYITIGDTKLTEAKANKLADKDYVDNAIDIAIENNNQGLKIGQVDFSHYFEDYLDTEAEIDVTSSITFKPVFYDAQSELDQPMILVSSDWQTEALGEMIFHNYYARWIRSVTTMEIYFRSFYNETTEQIIKLVYKYTSEEDDNPTITAYLSTVWGGATSPTELPIYTGTGSNSVQMINATASGDDSMAEGSSTASNKYAHAEGQGSIASGIGSHAEGGPLVWKGTYYTTASGKFSHAEGEGSTASAEGAHAEGLNSKAKARFAHTEGWDTVAEGTGAADNGAEAAHVEGYGTIAKVKAQHVEGRYNADEATALHITGCGTSDSARANCFTAGVDGGAKYIKVGDTQLTETELINVKNGGIAGTLPIEQGGTGATNETEATYNLLKGITKHNDAVAEDTRIAVAYSQPSSTKGAIAYKPMSMLWTYIAGKIRSAFGFNSSSVLKVTNGGTGTTTAGATALSNIGLKTARVTVKIPANGAATVYNLSVATHFCSAVITGYGTTEEKAQLPDAINYTDKFVQSTPVIYIKAKDTTNPNSDTTNPENPIFYTSIYIYHKEQKTTDTWYQVDIMYIEA